MKEKLCVVPTDGRIAELGGIIGPVSRPTKISYSAIVSMLNRGVPVYEVNPKNVNERVRLNFRNVNSVNFFPKVKKSQPTTVNSYKLPEGRRNTVVEHTSKTHFLGDGFSIPLIFYEKGGILPCFDLKK